jgi:hypothetical protein
MSSLLVDAGADPVRLRGAVDVPGDDAVLERQPERAVDRDLRASASSASSGSTFPSPTIVP